MMLQMGKTSFYMRYLASDKNVPSAIFFKNVQQIMEIFHQESQCKAFPAPTTVVSTITAEILRHLE